MERYRNIEKYGKKVINIDYFRDTIYIDDLIDGHLFVPSGKINYSIDMKDLKHGQVIKADQRFDPILDGIRVSERRLYRQCMNMRYNR